MNIHELGWIGGFHCTFETSGSSRNIKMNKAPPKLKRKKKVSSCPNPLFVKWLTEWRDEAAGKGIKTQYAYGKALSTLKKYPLPFQSGKAAKILDNFGDKICGMLDKKLEAHMANQGSATSAESQPLNPDSDEDDPLPSLSGIQADKPAQNKNRATSSHKSPRRASLNNANPRSATKRPREYIPLHRSGPYSLILTLYQNHTRPGSKCFMTKAELQREAQPLCDKSLTMPDPGSHYTAWSSMGTLISKGFIIKEGNPARFIITESGCELAHRLESVNGQQPKIPRTSSEEDDVTMVIPTHSPEPESSRENRLPTLPSTETPCYWYIDDNGREVTSKDQAVVDIDDDLTVGFLIKCSRNALRNSSLRYRPDTSRSPPTGFTFAFLHNDDALEESPASRPRIEDVSRTASHPTGARSHASHPRVSGSQTDARASHPKPASSRRPDPIVLQPSCSSVSSSLTNQATCRRLSEATAKTAVRETSHASRVKDGAQPLYTLRPGQFDVILCVDNCETSGVGASGKGRKQVLLKELHKNGVSLDVRKLQVGDFLWVAREKGSAVPGLLQMPQRRELVLDYVVERKRMDDLCSSIQDGRFKEQKFRLKQSGLRHPIYLVESFGSADHMSLPAVTLQQSVVNTQIVDGFFVKHTQDSKESAAYLTILTRYLHNVFSEKTLKAYSRDDLNESGVASDISSREQACLTFQEFNDSSVKNKETSVTETFAKQLLQFSGMTAEKALALTQLHNTPSSLMDAYDSCALPIDQEKMLAKIKFGHSQRNLGPALSKIVYQHYCTSTALT